MADPALNAQDDEPLPPIRRPLELKPKPKQLHPNRFELAAGRRNVWQATAEAGVSIDDLKRPDYWAHISNQVRLNDKFEVVTDDGGCYAEFLVRDCGSGYVKVSALPNTIVFSESIEPGAAIPESDYEVRWSGPHTLFRVLRKSDGKMLQERIANKTDANIWITNHMKAMR